MAKDKKGGKAGKVGKAGKKGNAAASEQPTHEAGESSGSTPVVDVPPHEEQRDQADRDTSVVRQEELVVQTQEPQPTPTIDSPSTVAAVVEESPVIIAADRSARQEEEPSSLQQSASQTEASASSITITIPSTTVSVPESQPDSEIMQQDATPVITTSSVTSTPNLPSETVVVSEQTEQTMPAQSNSSLDLPALLSGGTAMSSSSSSASSQTASILAQLQPAPVQVEAPVLMPARFIDPQLDLIERIIAIENAGGLDEEALKNVRETASRGFTAVLMVEKLVRDFPQLFFFSGEYITQLKEEVKRHQLQIERIQRLCIAYVLEKNFEKLAEENRKLFIDIVQADTVESLSVLLRENKDKLGNFSIGVETEEGKRYSEKILHEKLCKKIRQEAVFQLISHLFNNVELLQQNENMTLLFNIVNQKSSVNSYVSFKLYAPQLGLSDLESLDGLDEIFNNKKDHESLQAKLKSCYETLIEKRKNLFARMTETLLDLRFMQADKIYQLVDLFHPEKKPKFSYDALKQQAHLFNMPEFPGVFNNVVDEKEFIYIQARLKECYFKLKEERDKQIKAMCVNCSDTKIMAPARNRTRLSELVNQTTTPAQCHEFFKQYADNFGIERFSEIFENMIYQETAFLQNELRYQRMRLSINEKFAIPSDRLIEDDVLQLRIFANQLERSESIAAYLEIREFGLPQNWEEEAKFLAHKAVAKATMIFRKVDPSLIEEIETILTTRERCIAVYQLVYMRLIIRANNGLTHASIIGLAEGSLQIKHLVAPKTKPSSVLHDSKYALHQHQQINVASASTTPTVAQ